MQAAGAGVEQQLRVRRSAVLDLRQHPGEVEHRRVARQGVECRGHLRAANLQSDGPCAQRLREDDDQVFCAPLRPVAFGDAAVRPPRRQRAASSISSSEHPLASETCAIQKLVSPYSRSARIGSVWKRLQGLSSSWRLKRRNRGAVVIAISSRLRAKNPANPPLFSVCGPSHASGSRHTTP